MSSHSVKSMKELMDSFLKSSNISKSGFKAPPNSEVSTPETNRSETSTTVSGKMRSTIQDAKLEKVFIDLFTESCLPYFRYGYHRESTLIVGIKNASWATRLKLLQVDIIRRYNQELKSGLSTKLTESYNEKTLITRMIIKVSPN